METISMRVPRILPRLLLLAVLVCCSAVLPSYATTVSGNLKDLGINNVTGSNSFVRFTLQGYGSDIPRVIGTNAIVRPDFDFTPDANGNISGTIQGNDTISIGSNPVGGTWYRVCIYYQGRPFRCDSFTINGNTFNLNNATPNTTNPAVPAPTG
ncbi:MAG: hypothetical protein KGI06_06325, partial [Candidatus Micrarchaeota archaeon]|nr:hypothetical protein [Candidatus Micrarchaeota archaeon]